MKIDPIPNRRMGFCFTGKFVRASREVELDQHSEGRQIVPSMKTMMVVLTTILFSLLFISQSSHADEIYKWVDEKGTIHFTDDPKTIPEKYRDQVQIKTFKESAPTMPLKRDVTETRQKQAPVGSQQGKESQYGRPFRAYDPTNDPEYQQMMDRLDKARYYQRDIYYRRTLQKMHRSGDYYPAGAAEAEKIRAKIEELASNPEYATSRDYRKRVRDFFESNFYQQDEYYARGAEILHRSGEIIIRTDKRRDRDEEEGRKRKKQEEQEEDRNPKHGEFLPRSGSGVINPRTGEFYPPSGPDGYINPRTGEIYPKSGSGAIKP